MINLTAVGILARQLIVLGAIIRSRHYISRDRRVETTLESTRAEIAPSLQFYIVIPVLREAAIIRETVEHFQAVAKSQSAQVVVVTTERELAEAASNPRQGDTVAVVANLCSSLDFLHLHHPDPRGLKGDQLNFAARQLSSEGCDNVFLVCYDADSRPPVSTLAEFARVIAENPGASVFHQSSRFELRLRPDQHNRRRTALSRLRSTVCDAGALRANRFVLGFELPRLRNRSYQVGPVKRTASSYVYAHITGHGLCIRHSLLINLPLPSQSVLEDMQYSFYLCSRNLPMIPIRSLDRAEVPDSLLGQVQQAARWFLGPARFRQYSREAGTLRGKRATFLGLSALGSALEWLGCAVVPVGLILQLRFGGPFLRITTAATILVYLVQLIVTEVTLGSRGSAIRRALRVLTCPLSSILHGAGGFIGASRLVTGNTTVDKTERFELA